MLVLVSMVLYVDIYRLDEETLLGTRRVERLLLNLAFSRVQLELWTITTHVYFDSNWPQSTLYTALISNAARQASYVYHPVINFSLGISAMHYFYYGYSGWQLTSISKGVVTTDTGFSYPKYPLKTQDNKDVQLTPTKSLYTVVLTQLSSLI